VRLKGFDYSTPGAYFVTIVTQARAMSFGAVVAGEMQLSRIGTVADRCRREIPVHFPHVELGVPIVMPNHVHGILMLRGNIRGARL
jgi:putative transposase